uniref:Sugar transporter SWEET1 n=1 Tax=Corvus moneduloides TaxID=1196302 RepID=A0A8U7NZI1_CORMO
MAPAVLAGVCLAATLAMFATGLSDLRQILATKSVENIQFLPFLTTDANNLSWLGYGCLKGDGTLITVNAIGAALQTLYILVYLYYSPAKRSVLLQVLLLLAVVVTGYSYFTILVDTGTRLTHLGLFCSIFTITMYLSPLADLAKVVRSKSTRCLSFPLTVTTFVASSSWTLYGLQLHDPYITVGWGGGKPRGAIPSHSIPSHPIPIPSQTILLHCILRSPIPIPFHSSPSHPTLSHPIPSCPIPFPSHPTPSPFHPIPKPSHPIPLCPIPSHSALSHPIPSPSYPILFHSIPSHSTPFPSHGSAEHLAWGRPCSAPPVSPSQG